MNKKIEPDSILRRTDIPEDIKESLSESQDYKALLESRVEILNALNRKLQHEIEHYRSRNEHYEKRLTINPRSGLFNHFKMDKDLTDVFSTERDIEKLSSMGIIIIRLDNNYDMINKTLKPSMSEWIIYQIGARLSEAVSGYGSLYHPREDEFLILYDQLNSADELKQYGNKIHKIVVEPHIFTGYHISIGCNIGMASYPDHGMNKSRLLHNADLALLSARKQDCSCLLFEESMREEMVEKVELQNSILKALESQAVLELDKQFFMFFQPQVEILGIENDKIITGRINAEALIRWNHPQRGLISPGKFIPVAEETGLILPIGNWVLYHCVEQLEEWGDLTETECPVISLNVSARQFKSDDFVDTVLRVVKNRNIRPEQLKLEITESCVMDDPLDAIEKINKLKDNGFLFSIDDFGTGYSSLNYLRKLPIDTLKIDKCFVDNVLNNDHDKAIIRAIAAMGKEMDFQIIAEGVEDYEQLKFLHNEGINIIQGYYLSKPLDKNDFVEYMKSESSAVN